MPTAAEKAEEKQREEITVLVIVIIIIFGVLALGWIKLPFETFSVVEQEEIELAEEGLVFIGATTTPKLGKTVRYLGYAQNRGWEGRIIKINPSTFVVEITKVITHTNNTYYLFPQACSGQLKLGVEAVGATITVPRECLVERKE